MVGYFINERGREERCSWFNDGNRGDNLKIIGMWKEPEPVKSSSDELPKPIKDFGYLEVVWYVNKTKDRYVPYGVTKDGVWLSTQYTSLSRGCYYATKEDCQAVCDWLMNR
ncbi:hypothetical protein [Rodentibacter pneumotropicus]|uniref:hypothetical protein n=1 Tax=Rodentibacter pneumotropicus TaxID=758 RepID=UPI001363B39B|nr:hypothetical protein [Rodentibacter pneumotropicus]